MHKRIVIDSLFDLVEYILKNDLSEAERNELLERENTVGLHLTLGMYIRNTYELSNSAKVPNLINEYLEIETKGRLTAEDNDTSKELLKMFLLNDDDISGSVINMLWSRLRSEADDNAR
jgi:hypothetical protein